MNKATLSDTIWAFIAGLMIAFLVNVVWFSLCWLAKKHILLAALPVLLVVGWWHRRDLQERYNRGRHNVGPTADTTFTIEGEVA